MSRGGAPALHLDFETRSVINLRDCGVYRMAEDPSTDIWCAAWALGAGEVQLWEMGDPFPEGILDALLRGAKIHAWNANFEHVIWNQVWTRYGAPRVPIEGFVCTMVRAAAVALPRKLEQCAEVLLDGVEKDMAGHRLAIQMAKPRRPRKAEQHLPGPLWWDDRERRDRLGAYCRQDVEVERALGAKLPHLTPDEHQLWILDQRANGRGVTVDVDLVLGAQAILDVETAEVNAEMRALTGGEVSAVTNHQELLPWVVTQGLATDTVRRGWVEEQLADPELDRLLERVLRLRYEAGRTSTAKLERFLAVASLLDFRVRGLLQFLAADTGRWGGRLVQPQNLPRPSLKVGEDLIDLLAGRGPWRSWGARDRAALVRLLYGPPHEAVASSLRGCLIAAPGMDLIAVDYEQIEARVLAWLAGQEDVLEAFRTHGKVYELMAAKIYGVPMEAVTKGSEMRQMGKVTVLGAGYQMGGSRFVDHAADYGLEITEERGHEVIGIFRETNHKIVQFWYDCERAARDAILDPQRSFIVGETETSVRRRSCGRVTYQMQGNFLTATLPSGRRLWYCSPRLEEREGWSTPAIRYYGIDSRDSSRRWRKQSTYGGKLVENLTQAVARDVMAAAVPRLEERGLEMLLTVHDEVILEVPREAPPETLHQVETLMCNAAGEWADGLPIAAEGWRGRRYRK